MSTTRRPWAGSCGAGHRSSDLRDRSMPPCSAEPGRANRHDATPMPRSSSVRRTCTLAARKALAMQQDHQGLSSAARCPRSRTSSCHQLPTLSGAGWASRLRGAGEDVARPPGCHDPRVEDRRAMDAIFFRLRTGCQWNALPATGNCSSPSATRRFLKWCTAGVFRRRWRRGLMEHDALEDLDRSWLARGGRSDDEGTAREIHWVESHGSRQAGARRSLLREATGVTWDSPWPAPTDGSWKTPKAG